MINAIKADITTLDYDAIVNAANKSLLGGGGVDGAIHKAAGPELKEYNKTLGGCETGEAKIAPGFNLPAEYVILTVGPVWGESHEEKDRLLANCYQNSLDIGAEHGVKTIAFPSISTGVYRFPFERAAHIAVKTVKEWVENHDYVYDKITFVCFKDQDLEVYQKILKS